MASALSGFRKDGARHCSVAVFRGKGYNTGGNHTAYEVLSRCVHESMRNATRSLLSCDFAHRPHFLLASKLSILSRQPSTTTNVAGRESIRQHTKCDPDNTMMYYQAALSSAIFRTSSLWMLSGDCTKSLIPLTRCVLSVLSIDGLIGWLFRYSTMASHTKT
jgi:hypothetical protein